VFSIFSRFDINCCFPSDPPRKEICREIITEMKRMCTKACIDYDGNVLSPQMKTLWSHRLLDKEYNTILTEMILEDLINEEDRFEEMVEILEKSDLDI